METAGARALHDRAQSVAASLQLTPSADAAAAAPLLLELAELTDALRETALALTDAQSRGMWLQRAEWLRDEAAKMGAARIADGGAGPLLAALLDACARQCRAAAEAAQRAAASAPLPPPAPAQHAPSPRGALAVLQVRTELMMAQEQLARRTADRRVVTQRFCLLSLLACFVLACVLLAEAASSLSSQLSADVVTLSEARASAAAEAAAHGAELATSRADAARQADVIAALMSRSEQLCADAGAAREAQTESEALRRGLAQQSGTIERLIALNEELAGAANARSAHRDAGGAESAPAEAAEAEEQPYEDEWEAEEAAARARGDPPPRGWLSRVWGARGTEACDAKGASDDAAV